MDAIASLPNDEIILLPNNKNVILAAQQAASIAVGRTVIIVPSVSVPQGVAAMLEYDNVRATDELAPASELVEAMQGVLRHVVTGEITTAVRDAESDHVRAGQFIGLLNDDLVTAGDRLPDVARDLLERADAPSYERITLYYGEGVNIREAKSLADEMQAAFPEQIFELIDGGQPLYPYIISVE
ncbi:MAG: hypothetical protein HC828_06475 [Blastochloris sp.]|nr:hypothetical protein [Blastochloris sp.]